MAVSLSKIYYHISVCMCVCIYLLFRGCSWHGTCVEVRGQLCGVRSVLIPFTKSELSLTASAFTTESFFLAQMSISLKIVFIILFLYVGILPECTTVPHACLSTTDVHTCRGQKGL